MIGEIQVLDDCSTAEALHVGGGGVDRVLGAEPRHPDDVVRLGERKRSRTPDARFGTGDDGRKRLPTRRHSEPPSHSVTGVVARVTATRLAPTGRAMRPP
jgi:hypothetical protein